MQIKEKKSNGLGGGAQAIAKKPEGNLMRVENVPIQMSAALLSLLRYIPIISEKIMPFVKII